MYPNPSFLLPTATMSVPFLHSPLFTELHVHVLHYFLKAVLIVNKIMAQSIVWSKPLRRL